jgi:hypothetical protein
MADRAHTVARHIQAVLGIGLSHGVSIAYNTMHTSENQSIVLSVEGDDLSFSPSLPGPEYFNFDIILLSIAFHHVEYTQLMNKKLNEGLRDGGVLDIFDWLSIKSYF